MERRWPAVYSRDEVAAIMGHLHGTHRLQVGLMYGTGMRSAELLSLRVKDIDFGSNYIFVRGSKGNRDDDAITITTEACADCMGRKSG